MSRKPRPKPRPTEWDELQWQRQWQRVTFEQLPGVDKMTKEKQDDE